MRRLFYVSNRDHSLHVLVKQIAYLNDFIIATANCDVKFPIDKCNFLLTYKKIDGGFCYRENKF